MKKLSLIILLILFIVVAFIINCEDYDGEPDTNSDTTTSTYSNSSSTIESSSLLKKVNLLEPENNEKICNSLVTLRWDELAIEGGGISYKIQLSTLANMGDPENYNTEKSYYELSGTSTPPDINYPKLYYWKVRGYTNVKEGDWSDVYIFKYGDKTNISKPTLVSPDINIDNGIVCNGNAIYKWHPISNVNQYELEIASDTDFMNIVFIEDGISITNTDPSTTVEYNCLENISDGVYYWRVKGITNDCIGDYTNPFTIEYLTLTHPINLSPEHNSTVSTSKPTFSWDEVDNALIYNIEISTDSDFGAGKIIDTDVNSNSYYPADIDLTASKYYWRVLAKKYNCSSCVTNPTSSECTSCETCYSTYSSIYILNRI